MNETDLESRLAALEARAPGGSEPPALVVGSRRGRRSLLTGFATAPVALLLVASTALAGGVVIGGLVAQAHPGAENPGQPLAGAGLECMTPRQAAEYLAAHGFTQVVWQVESSGTGGKGSDTSTQVAAPPEHGYVVPGAILGDGQLIMIIDQRAGATGVGACHGEPMP
jgi:hypothetical protein